MAGVLTDQYCHMMTKVTTVGLNQKKFQQLLGYLYSIILSGVNYRRYRIRLYQSSAFKVNHFVVRVLACLSCETEATDAQINQQERLKCFGILQRDIHPQVSFQVTGSY